MEALSDHTQNKNYWKAYTEEVTGGPGGCQISRGGTCQRPDIFTSTRQCSTCEFVEFCLCEQKTIKPPKLK